MKGTTLAQLQAAERARFEADLLRVSPALAAWAGARLEEGFTVGAVTKVLRTKFEEMKAAAEVKS